MGILSRFFDSNKKQIDKFKPTVRKINEFAQENKDIKDSELKSKTEEFKKKLRTIKPDGLNKEPVGLSDDEKRTLDEILPEAYALVKVATKRTQNIDLHDEQLIAAISLHQGKIAEQKTGEGKTNTATLPLYLNALLGRGCHLVTPNDYLSRHGAGWMGPIYNLLGVSVGVVFENGSYIHDPEFKNTQFEDPYAQKLKPVERKQAYAADITYGTNHEFGFDYLRDNMAIHISQLTQRGHHFAIIDEVDSILIDVARTPLIISEPDTDPTLRYAEFAGIAEKLLSDTDYEVDEKARSATLTELGIRKVERILGADNLYETDFKTIHGIENAIRAKSLYIRDRDYIVRDDQVKIVDEFTGRILERNRYGEGLHQAIEAKENVTIQKESKTRATISYQNYFRMYEKLAGMTGTAETEAEEFYKIYGLEVVVVPTHEPVNRKDNPDVVYKTKSAKLKAIVDEIEKMNRIGRPVLIGTTSIEKNEELGRYLKRRNIKHELLNAKHHEKEALIIAQAGRKGAVTLATNMAGRGVDIILGGDPLDIEKKREVVEVGGLHVIGTDRHEARRIDNQLRGRSGRQGEPGSSRFFISLQDDLMRIFGGERVERLMDRFGLDENIPLEAGMVSKAIENAQKKVEGLNFDQRKYTVEYDDVLNQQRDLIYKIRRRFLQSGGNGVIKPDGLNLEDLEWLYGKLVPYSDELAKVWEEKEKEYPKLWKQVVRLEALRVIDFLWMEHLDTMKSLGEGVGLRGYAQKDPLVEYKKEGHMLFEKLMQNIYFTIADRLTKVEIRQEVPARDVRKPDGLTKKSASLASSGGAVGLGETKNELEFKHGELEVGVRDEGVQISQGSLPQTTQPIRSKKKVGRNDPCFCGSGKKYKRCHGR